MDNRSMSHTKWIYQYHIILFESIEKVLLQILLERYAHSEIGGTFILI